MFTLEDVLAGTAGRVAAGTRHAAFRAVAIDSRAVNSGDLFIAFKGQKHDGHRFVTQALAHGAAGALVEALPPDEPWASPDWDGAPVILTEGSGAALQDLATYWRRQHEVQVVGVTGSVGKTTTKEMIANVLAQRLPVLRSPANLNTEIGLPMTLMSLDRTYRAAVLEMAMLDLGEIARLAAIAQPNVGVVTVVQPTHLQRLKTIERIAEAKSELPRALPADGLVVLNWDDERVRAMHEITPAQPVYYGLSPQADVWADRIESHGLRGIEFTVHHGAEQLRARMDVLGTHSVHSALATIAVAMHFGFSFDDAVAGLKQVQGGLRLLVAEGVRGSTILDDTYNANPASTHAALNLLAEMTGRRVAVLGDMLELGSYELEGHQIVGRRAAAVCDWLITVGPRARTIAEEAIASGMRPSAVEHFDLNEEVIARLETALRPGDFVLFKGSHSMRLDNIVSAIRVAA
ncbi:MAG: UDP-N-acetylmuramoyl-tripeptide--D-alanyl-D-alanine ligase [Chloroflexota bacterium]|jgi:UDP-N-acetylmuramoyl-tripeptide--D-alanyl-D-alanine ligase|nr:UDP-N-acetylmuramoyl-tripeptide--D-alanyl-D-alanine ligase [Chloroflexota bacterium]